MEWVFGFAAGTAIGFLIFGMENGRLREKLKKALEPALDQDARREKWRQEKWEEIFNRVLDEKNGYSMAMHAADRVLEEHEAKFPNAWRNR